MNTWHLLVISFAAIFGSGWLFSPLYAAQLAGPYSLLAWLIGAIVSAVIGITLAEVVVLVPQTGGLTQAAELTHGAYLGFILTLFNAVVYLLLPAIEVRAILQYAATSHQIFGDSAGDLSAVGQLSAIALLAALTWVNVYGAQITLSLTGWMAGFKVLTPILLCGLFAWDLGISGFCNSARLVPDQPLDQAFRPIMAAIATSGILFSYNGFNQATLFAGECAQPQRAIPRAILGSLGLAGLLYLLIQYTFIMALPADALSGGWRQLHFTHQAGPFAGLAQARGLSGLLVLIYLDALISPLGTAFSYASAAPRLLAGFFRNVDGSIRQISVNRHGVSVPLVVFTLVMETLVLILLPSLRAMIALLVAAFVLCYTAAPASLLELRRTHPQLPRVFRVAVAPLTCWMAVFFANLMVFSCGWVALRNLSILALSATLLWISPLMSRPAKSAGLQSGAWFLGLLGSLCALSYWDQQHPLGIVSLAVILGALSACALQASRRQTPSAR